MSKWVVIMYHNFDAEIDATSFDNYDKAKAYLHWKWEKYYNEEIKADSNLNEAGCYYEDIFAKVEWEDGCVTYFELDTLREEAGDDDFEKNWERYV